MAMDYLKLIKAQETKDTYTYKNTKDKLNRTDAAICFNKLSRLNNLISHIL
jgi:phage terminase Nu1 subunit (DNA packaging protein)